MNPYSHLVSQGKDLRLTHPEAEPDRLISVFRRQVVQGVYSVVFLPADLVVERITRYGYGVSSVKTRITLPPKSATSTSIEPAMPTSVFNRPVILLSFFSPSS
ncbi:MAG: hypothetical protein JXM70_09750 [Pirellulales bacterium]|nr:hypothetical protein [Pirellulales bacterium]